VPESLIFDFIEKVTMKKYAFLLLVAAANLTASAQNLPAAAKATGKEKEDLGATPYGLPVNKSYVAPDVVERAKKKYGRSLYSIEKSAAQNCEESYLVGLIQKGKLSLEWMCDDPKLVWQQRKSPLAMDLLMN
jgi:hypothetical protein